MSCGCQHRDRSGKPVPTVDTPERIDPSEECVFCAEKHLDTAYSLWKESLASGYSKENRADTVGQLCLCAWHTWRKSRRLAEIVRDIRHEVQARREKKVDFAPAIAEMEKLVLEELEKNSKKEG